MQSWDSYVSLSEILLRAQSTTLKEEILMWFQQSFAFWIGQEKFYNSQEKNSALPIPGSGVSMDMRKWVLPQNTQQ